MSVRLTPFRKAMIWAFRAPGSPYVTLNASVDFGAARDYLARLNGGEHVSVQHLLVGAISQVLREYPEANARVVGRIVPTERIGVVMPVNLIGHSGGANGALGVAIIEDADTLSLRGIAARCSAHVNTERGGGASNRLMGGLLRLADRAPRRVLEATLDAFFLAVDSERVLRRIERIFPATTMLSNAGAVLGRDVEAGMMFRSATMFVPPKLSWLGTLWATSFVQDEVVPVHGVPRVRPMLPVIFIFDHRLIDGVLAGRILVRFGQIIQDPAAVFGEDGNDEPGVL